MRKMTQKITQKMLALGMTLTLSVTLWACGGNGSAQSTAQTDQTTVQTAESAAGAGVTISNNLNGETFDVTYDTVPQRVVSASSFMTEMLLALGLEDHIAGYCYQDNEVLPQYQEAYAKLTCLSDKNPSQEVLLQTEPDFLTGWESTFSDKNFSKDFCEQNHIKIYVPKVEGAGASLESVYQDLKNLGQIFQVEDRAEKLISDMQAQVAEVEAKVADKTPVSVFIYDSGEASPFTAGAGLASDMIEKAGGYNVFKDAGDYWITVSWEEVVAANPKYIIVMDYDMSDDTDAKVDYLKNNEALKNVDAIKNGNIFVLGLADFTGGIRNTQAIEDMARKFHPECFE